MEMFPNYLESTKIVHFLSGNRKKGSWGHPAFFSGEKAQKIKENRSENQMVRKMRKSYNSIVR